MEWIFPAVQDAIRQGEKVSPWEVDLTVGLGEKGEFYTMCWAYGQHFRIMSRDLDKKTTLDFGILVWFDVEGDRVQYYGYLEQIVRLKFDGFETILFKGKFWDSVIRQRDSNAMVLEDECGFHQVKAGNYIIDTKAADEPFVFPKDVTQVFDVDDRVNIG